MTQAHTPSRPQDVLDFWFHELQPEDWWQKDLAIDALITERYSSLLEAARRCELWTWRDSAQGRLAEILVLDQFSRHIHRDHGDAFAGDALALALAQEAVRGGWDQQLELLQRRFFYKPYMHSESPRVHEEAMRLYSQPGLEQHLEFEIRHKDIIDRFGRYPHRNALLGRTSTPEELAFLEQPGSSF